MFYFYCYGYGESVLMIYYLVSVADTFILRNTCEWLNCEYTLAGYFIEGFLYEPARYNLKIWGQGGTVETKDEDADKNGCDIRRLARTCFSKSFTSRAG